MQGNWNYRQPDFQIWYLIQRTDVVVV